MSSEAAVPESVVARLRPHARALVLPSLALVVATGLTGYFFGRFDEVWENAAVLSAGAIAIVLLWMLPLAVWLSSHYVLTTRRIVIRRGLVTRTRQELLHSRGYDVTVRRSGLQSVFRSGDLLINTGLDRPVVLRDVPGADLVQAALQDLMENSVSAVATRRQQEASRPDDETTVWGTR